MSVDTAQQLSSISNAQASAAVSSPAPALPLTSGELKQLASQLRDAPPNDVSRKAIVAGMRNAGVSGKPTDIAALAKIDPQLAQAVLNRQYETMSNIMKGWAESERINALADKKSAEKHYKKMEGIYNRVAKAADTAAAAAANAIKPRESTFRASLTPDAPRPSNEVRGLGVNTAAAMLQAPRVPAPGVRLTT